MTRRTVWKRTVNAALGLLLALSMLAPLPSFTFPQGWFVDGFSSTRLDSAWSVIGRDDSALSLNDPRGSLTLTTRDANLYETDNRPVNVVLRNAPKDDYDLTTKLRFDPQQDYEQAGLVLWAGQDDYAQLTYSHQGGLALLGGVESHAKASLELLENTAGTTLFLRLSRHKDLVSFAVSADGLRWTRVGQPVRSTTTYTKVGIFSSASGSKRAIPAHFDFVTATPYLRLPSRPDPKLPPDSTPAVAGTGEASVAYQNPVQSWTSGDPATADPGVARGPDGWYYLVGSESEYSFSPYHALPIFRSRDLVNWTYLSDVFPDRASYPSWAEDSVTDKIDFWAPDIHFVNGKVYVYFGATQKSDPAVPTNNKAIGVAVADSPTGPFTAAASPMIIGADFRAIDEQVFTDTDGSRYIYWGSEFYPILAQRLSADGMSVTGPVTQVLPSHQGSSYIFDTATTPAQPNLENLIEGAWVMKRGSWYYLFYSGPNCCGPGANYTVAVARSTSPLGPFDKLTTNPILRGNEKVLAPGHNAIATDDAGTDWMVYHAMDAVANPLGDASRRNLSIDRIEWRNGWPIVDGPTTDPVVNGPIIRGGSGDVPPLPDPVAALASGTVTTDSADLTWAAAAGGPAPAGYRTFRDGVATGDVPPTARSTRFTGLATCTRYAFSVRPIADDGRLGDAGDRREVTTAGCPEGSATNRTVDRATAGNWIGVYGSDGYTLAGDATKAAAGVTVVTPATPYTWSGDTTETRALQRASGDGRLAATWFGGSVPVTVSVAPGEARRITLYVLDWDSPGERRQNISVTNQQGDVIDQVSGADLGAFDQGAAVSWTITGDVTITANVESGANAVVSGVFVDPVV